MKHVAKNKEAPHLKSVAIELYFYELYNLDVLACIVGIVALSVFIFINIIKSAVALVVVSKPNKSKKL